MAFNDPWYGFIPASPASDLGGSGLDTSGWPRTIAPSGTPDINRGSSFGNASIQQIAEDAWRGIFARGQTTAPGSAIPSAGNTDSYLNDIFSGTGGTSTSGSSPATNASGAGTPSSSSMIPTTGNVVDRAFALLGNLASRGALIVVGTLLFAFALASFVKTQRG